MYCSTHWKSCPNNRSKPPPIRTTMSWCCQERWWCRAAHLGTQHWLLPECSAFTAPGEARPEHWLGVIPQCFSTVHTVHLRFAQIGKHSSLTPLPNSRVKLTPGVKPPIIGRWAIVMLQLELKAQSPWLCLLRGCLGCVCAVFLRKQPQSAPGCSNSCQCRLVPQPWKQPGFGKAVKTGNSSSLPLFPSRRVLCCVSSGLPAEPLWLGGEIPQGSSTCSRVGQFVQGWPELSWVLFQRGLWAVWSPCQGF